MKYKFENLPHNYVKTVKSKEEQRKEFIEEALNYNFTNQNDFTKINSNNYVNFNLFTDNQMTILKLLTIIKKNNLCMKDNSNTYYIKANIKTIAEAINIKDTSLRNVIKQLKKYNLIDTNSEYIDTITINKNNKKEKLYKYDTVITFNYEVIVRLFNYMNAIIENPNIINPNQNNRINKKDAIKDNYKEIIKFNKEKLNIINKSLRPISKEKLTKLYNQNYPLFKYDVNINIATPSVNDVAKTNFSEINEIFIKMKNDFYNNIIEQETKKITKSIEKYSSKKTKNNELKTTNNELYEELKNNYNKLKIKNNKQKTKNLEWHNGQKNGNLECHNEKKLIEIDKIIMSNILKNERISTPYAIPRNDLYIYNIFNKLNIIYIIFNKLFNIINIINTKYLNITKNKNSHNREIHFRDLLEMYFSFLQPVNIAYSIDAKAYQTICYNNCTINNFDYVNFLLNNPSHNFYNNFKFLNPNSLWDNFKFTNSHYDNFKFSTPSIVKFKTSIYSLINNVFKIPAAPLYKNIVNENIGEIEKSKFIDNKFFKYFVKKANKGGLLDFITQCEYLQNNFVYNTIADKFKELKMKKPKELGDYNNVTELQKSLIDTQQDSSVCDNIKSGQWTSMKSYDFSESEDNNITKSEDNNINWDKLKTKERIELQNNFIDEFVKDTNKADIVKKFIKLRMPKSEEFKEQLLFLKDNYTKIDLKIFENAYSEVVELEKQKIYRKTLNLEKQDEILAEQPKRLVYAKYESNKAIYLAAERPDLYLIFEKGVFSCFDKNNNLIKIDLVSQSNNKVIVRLPAGDKVIFYENKDSEK